MSAHRTHSFCAVPLPTTIYAGPATKEEFDRIALPVTVHAWKPCKTTTLIKADGREWERRAHTKYIDAGINAPDVIFQWFDERAVEPVAAEATAP